MKSFLLFRYENVTKMNKNTYAEKVKTMKFSSIFYWIRSLLFTGKYFINDSIISSVLSLRITKLNLKNYQNIYPSSLSHYTLYSSAPQKFVFIHNLHDFSFFLTLFSSQSFFFKFPNLKNSLNTLIL